MQCSIALMQPYLFPYIGYFQLINAVDRFVIHDDVQFIKAGWINRNRILVNGKDQIITFPLKKDSSFAKINSRCWADSFQELVKKNLRILHAAYVKAPHYSQVYSLVEEILNYNESNVPIFILRQLELICKYMGVSTQFILSSSINKDNELRSEERVIEINKRLGSTHYINPIGGLGLYKKDNFSKQGIKLSFIKTGPILYKQYDNEFIPDLSIIDVLMFNDVHKVQELLSCYEEVIPQ